MGGDLYQELWKKDFLVFQSTPPLWEATSDIIGGVDVNTDFNPRLHYGRRLASTADNMFSILFQSTPPLWEATFLIRDEEGNIKISIHASTMGGDYLSKYFQWPSPDFNPRLHYGRRLDENKDLDMEMTISIHASTMGGDADSIQLANVTAGISIHASTMGGD